MKLQQKKEYCHDQYTVPLNYNFTFPRITMRVIMRGIQCIPLRVCVDHVS